MGGITAAMTMQADIPAAPRATGAALLRAESELDATGLTRDIGAILTDPARAAAMAAASLKLGRPDAASRLYDLVTEIAA